MIVSRSRYQAERPDLILMAINSQVRSPPAFGEVPVRDWQPAGAPQAFRLSSPFSLTLEQRLVRKTLGTLNESDRSALNTVLDLLLGS